MNHRYGLGAFVGAFLALGPSMGARDALLRAAWLGLVVHGWAITLRALRHLPAAWRWLRRATRYRVRVVKLDGESA
jgi:hypothetical protein